MNSVVFSGNMVKEADIRMTKNGNKCANFSLAVWRSPQKTDFFDCKAWDKVADKMEDCRKGDKLLVSGNAEQVQYETMNGKVNKVVFNIYTIEKLTKHDDVLKVDPRKQPTLTGTESFTDADMPSWNQNKAQSDIGINSDNLPFY